ncbi:titin homolog isoform X5 [Syngnathoides biaculeatus]|uniref:titin homolog isoform X5 n=1 Tax=Syngnathoides biaculeatus TaxID=300417 RepID=UPI002ADDDA85|nr:titin homolog isoform X5 [Syngnathoides biaculeatus]
MDRYGDLDLDLECDDGGDVAQKATLFGGIFKKSSKLVEAQDNLSVSSELSKSNDSLNDSAKDKGGMFKGMFKKQPKSSKEPQQVALSQHNPELSDSLDDSKSSKDKSGMLGGILKKPPRRGHARRPSQDLLDIDMSASNNMNENTKESGGMFSGMFKKAPKRTQSQDNLFENDEQSGSSNNPAVNSNAKESAGMFGGMFKKSPKPLKEKTKSQDDLSQSSELSASSENLSEGGAKEKGGLFSGVFKKHKHPAATRTLSQEDLTAASELSDSSDSLAEKSKEKSQGSKENLSEKPKVKQNGFSAMMKNAFYSEKQEKENTDADVSKETTDNSENQAAHKQSKLNMLNPFRSGKEKQSDSSDEDTPSAGEKSSGHKQNGVKGAMSKLNPFKAANKKDTEDNETLKEADRQVEGKQKLKNNAIDRERKQRSETPPLPRRPAQEEKSGTQVQDKAKEKASEDAKDNKDMTSQQRTDKEPPKVPPRKPSQEELRSRAANAQVPKQENQHQNRSEGELLKEDVEVEAATPAENKANEGGNRSLFDQLEEFRIDPAQPEDRQDMDGLMEWWNTVESWEDTPQNDDMTEKEEAKAFALTADKVQKGIRVFNKLFSERAESLWQHVIDLNSMADALDKFNKNTKIAQITGGSTSAIGGVATIAGLALAPVTLGTSLIVTAVGLGVATAGGLTSAGAGISNQVNNSMDRKKVEKIVEDYQEKIADLNKCLKFIKQGIENLRRFDLIKMKNNAYNRDFPVLSSSFYEDGAMAGKAILINANEIMRVVQIANVAGSTAARAVQIASMATGVLTGLFVGMDIYFVAKDSKELKKGAKSEFAAKIREVATQLHEGLVELNTIREELQSTSAPLDEDQRKEKEEEEEKKKKKGGFDYDSSEEDEIDRIKKAIKKDLDNREYV